VPPDADDMAFGRAIHERMIVGDPVASSDLCESYLLRLERILLSQFPTTGVDLVHDAAIEAVLGYIQHPVRYDPSRRSLFGYLLMSARGDLMNLRERHRGWLSEQPMGDAVELDGLVRNRTVTEVDVVDAVADDLAASRLLERALAVAHDDEERTVLRLMLGGEKSTDVYAAALGWHDLAPAERRARLYRLKDRLNQRLKRLRNEAERD
jgi:RNA polymerase sigma-70 factor (ECF subfamily)